MAISKFIIPAGGLSVTGSTTLSGTVVVTDNVSVTQLTASDHVSASNGYFANLDVAQLTAPSLNLSGNLIVSGNTTLGYDVGEDVLTVNAQLTASAGAEVSSGLVLLTGDLAVSAGNASVSGSLQVTGAAELAGGLTVTGAPLDASAVAVSASALEVTGDFSAASGTLTGDLTVGGDLTVNGALTYLNTQNLLIKDKEIVIASGSANAAAADLAGIYLGSDSAPIAKFYFDQAGKWVSDQALEVSGGIVATSDISSSTKVTAPNAEFNTVTGSASGSQAQFGEITGSSISASVSVVAPSLSAVAYGSSKVAVAVDTLATGTLDTFDTTNYQAAKYLVKAASADSKTHALEVLVAADGTLVYNTSYASLYTSDAPMIRADSSIAGGTVTVKLYNDHGSAVTASVMKFVL